MKSMFLIIQASGLVCQITYTLALIVILRSLSFKGSDLLGMFSFSKPGNFGNALQYGPIC